MSSGSSVYAGSSGSSGSNGSNFGSSGSNLTGRKIKKEGAKQGEKSSGDMAVSGEPLLTKRGKGDNSDYENAPMGMGPMGRRCVPIENRIAALENRLNFMWQQAKRFTMKSQGAKSKTPAVYNSGASGSMEGNSANSPINSAISFQSFNPGDVVSCGGKEPFTVYSAKGPKVYSGQNDLLGKLASNCKLISTSGASVPFSGSSGASAPLSGGRATRRAKRSGKKSQKTRSRR